MAAISKRLLHLRRSSHSFTRPYPYTYHRHFSSSDDHDDAPKPESPPPVSSSLNDERANLQNAPPPGDRPQPPRNPFSFPRGAPFRSPPPSSGAGPVDDIPQLLANFRARSAPPPPPSGDKHISMHELYLKNVKSRSESSGGNFDSIRQSLSNMAPSGAANAGRKAGDSFSRLANYRMNADPNSKFARGSGGQIWNVANGQVDLRPELGKVNELEDFGKKLQALRPEKRKGNWFSLQELSDRITKLRKAGMVNRENTVGLPFAVSDSIYRLAKDDELKARNKPQQVTVGVLSSMGAAATLAEQKGPPKNHLCEQYFHPDHMSSAEKMKLELAKVRDEFKMSESDCGSARVQVAQLTTKIKHLSSALHKKDKHSRRGLLAMVQRRKRLLKYLRRTDWDSYCLVLEKLGLRDNFDIKAYMPKLR